MVGLNGGVTNALLTPSPLPFGLPPYPYLTDADYREAFRVGMAEQLAALDDIATDPEPPTIANTLHAWERSNATLTRATNAFWVAKAADATEGRNALEEEFAPLFAAHQDAIRMDPRLHHRLTVLRDRAAAGELTPDEQDEHLLEELIRSAERGGILLPQAQQARLREINIQLAALGAAFERELTAGRNEAAVHVLDGDELAGLADDELAAAREAARAAGLEGWLLDLVNTTGQPVLARLTDRALRERIHRASINRGLSGVHDVRRLMLDAVNLRSERARLLGFEHHAAYVAADLCARTTGAVNELLRRVAPGVRSLVEREAGTLQALLEADHPGERLQPWDWQFYSARAAASRSVDPDSLTDHFEFHNVLHDGVFAAATALYGITFHHRPDLHGYTGEAMCFEVREADSSPLGLVVLDAFTRDSKQGGAWMTSIVEQSGLTGDAPVVTCTCNFPRPAPGHPSLLSWDDVITLFHEFGHDLHWLFSDVRYPSRSAAVPSDFVEFPSQVNEIWARHPALLARYARHHATNAPLPAAAMAALIQPEGAGDAYETFEALAAQLLDQAWHQAPPERLPRTVDDVEAFERNALQEAGVDFAPIPPRYRSAFFAHIFGGGYSAAYYSYLWSEVMDADTVAWFDENGGLCREAGDRFRRELLAPGASVDPMLSYRRFRGADPDLTHLLRRIGLEASPAPGVAG